MCGSHLMWFKPLRPSNTCRAMCTSPVSPFYFHYHHTIHMNFIGESAKNHEAVSLG